MAGLRTHNLSTARASWLAAGLAVFVAAAPAAKAQETAAAAVKFAQTDPFSALVGKKHERRIDRATRGKIERYVLASDDRAFLFEDRSAEARVKFLCAPDDPRLDCTIDPQGPTSEIYILTATRAPRGDVIYKNRQGDTFLRIASYGGATVFWPGEAQGLAASKSFGDEQSLTLPFADYETARRRADAATAIISAVTGAPIIFDVGPAPTTPHANAAVLADAVVVTAKGLKAVADDPTGARIIASRIKKAAFIAGAAPSIEFNGAVMEIRYVPIGDIEGRPSSAAVARFLEETL